MSFSISDWLVKANRIPGMRGVMASLLPSMLKKKAGGETDDAAAVFDVIFFRDRMGNVDTNKDGVEDAFRICFTNHWFDQRILGFGVSVDGRPVPDDQVYFRSAERLYPVGRLAAMEFAPGRMVECLLTRMTLSEGVHFIELRISLEYAEAFFPPLPVSVRDDKADFAFLPEYAPRKLPAGAALDVHLIPHVHYDAEWLQPHRIFETLGARNLLEALFIMEHNERYTFVIDQCAYLEPFMREHPAAFEKIRALAAEGRIEHVCGMYSEPDLNMPRGESLARQVVFWQKFALTHFGAPSTVGWLIDSFGQSAQIPQILALAGVRAHVFYRQGRADTPSEFLWEGLDATRIPTHCLPLAYSAAYPILEDQAEAERRFEHAIAALAERAATNAVFCPTGNDHARPQAHAPLFAALWNESHPAALAAFSLPSRFFDKLSGAELKTICGDFTGVFSGTHSSRIYLKTLNHKAETALMEAERLCAALAAAGRAPAPDFSELWKPVMLNQFHDVICGCCTDEVADGARLRYERAIDEAESRLTEAVREIGARVDVRGRFNPIIVFNPLPYEREEIVEVELYFEPGTRDFVITDGERELPRQVVSREDYADGTVKYARTLFAATAPGLGWRLFDVRKGAPDAAQGAAYFSEWTIGNESAEYHFHPEAAYIDRAALKSGGGREFVFLDAAEMLSQREAGDLYHTIGDGPVLKSRKCGFTVEEIESGPLRAVARVRGAMGNSTIEQTWTLRAGSPRLELKLRIDFRDEGRRLRMRFPLPWKNAAVTMGIPFGAMERGAGAHAALGWAAVAGPRRGFALFNKGVPAHSVEDGDLVVTLVRGADGILFHKSGPGGFCLGRHEMELALQPFEGALKDARIPAAAEEFHFPMRAYQIRRPAIAPPGGPLPESFSLLTIDNRAAALSGVCPSGDRRALVFRVFETRGETARIEAAPGFSPLKVEKVDLIERPSRRGAVELAGGIIRAEIEPWEIASFRMEYPID